MIELATAQLCRDSSARRVLAAYDAAEPEPVPAGQPAEGSAGWLARLRAVEGVPAEELSRIHGKLIALGFLEFELTGRAAGMLYRISPEGRSFMREGRGETASGAMDDEDDYPNS